MNQTQHPDILWPHRAIIGEADVPTIRSGRCLIRLKFYRSDETYSNHDDLVVPLSNRSGRRIYFGAKSYILIPDITLTIALTPSKAYGAETAKIIDTDFKQLQELEIGTAQAWYYPTENALVLWECFLQQPYRQQDLLADSLAATVWQGFEKELLTHLPDTERIYTTYETIYERPVWEAFLTAQGYQKVERMAFLKEVVSP